MYDKGSGSKRRIINYVNENQKRNYKDEKSISVKDYEKLVIK